MYNPGKKTNKLDGDISWYGANYVYEDIYDIQDKIRQCIIGNDTHNAIVMFDELLIIVLPYIKKYMNDEEKKLLENNDDLYSLQVQFKPENTDYEKSLNMKLSKSIIQKINHKRMKISHLMATANMGITLKPKEEYRPAALASDDW